MKKTLEKLVICILIIIMLSNFCMINYSNAEEGEENPLSDFIEEKQGSFVGVLTWPVRIIALLVGTAINDLTEGVAYTEGIIDENGNLVEGPESVKGTDTVITPFDIFFNRIAILDANFFNDVREGSIVSNIRTAIAGWYYAMRNIAASILLCVFIYVGIRMAISTVASDKAAYKKMLVDWVCSLVLIFLMQYIIIFTFSVNETFIHALSNVDDGTAISQAMIAIEALAHKTSNDAIAATVVYCMLVAQTIALFISYFNRMLKLAFLIIISPLITLTYSIDKMGDGKAQALGTWLKEFIYTVLIQSFHCIIYMAFIGMALSIFSTTGGDSNNMAGVILVMLCVKFTKDGEKILGKIFKFGEATSDTSLAVGMGAAALALQKAPAIGKGAKALVNGAKALPGGAKNMWKNAKVDAKTASNMFLGGMGLAAAREKAQADVLEAEAAKNEKGGMFHLGNFHAANEAAEGDDYKELDDKIEEAKNKKENEGKSDEEITNEVLKDEKGMTEAKKARYKHHRQVEAEAAANRALGMSAALAKAQARATVASRNRSSALKQRFPKITGAVGTVNKLRQFANSSETVKKIAGGMKGITAAGFGLATGSMVYGATGNEFTSIASGAAMYRGTQEFMKNTSKELTNQTADLLQASGDKSSADAAQHINNIRARADVFEDGSKLKEEIDKVFKDISKSMDEILGDDASGFKGRVQNILERSIADNPSITNDELMNILRTNGSTAGDMAKLEAGIGTAALTTTLGNVSDLKRDEAIYKKISSSGDAGIPADQMISRSLSILEANQMANGATASSKDTTYAQAIIDPSSVQEGGSGKSPSEMEVGELHDNIEALEQEASRLRTEAALVASHEGYVSQEEIKMMTERINRATEIEREADKLKIEEVEKKYAELQKQVAEYKTTRAQHTGKGEAAADQIMKSIKNDILSQQKAIIAECQSIARRNGDLIEVSGSGKEMTYTIKGSDKPPIQKAPVIGKEKK